MKKMAGVLALAVILGACGMGSDDGIIVIGDRFFVLQMHDIFLNRQQHLGRTIQYEGIFRTIYWPPTGNYYNVVMRYTLSCCGEVPIGFDIIFSDYFFPLPPNHAWVEVTGVLEEYDGFLVVRAISLIEMEDRGDGFVYFDW